MTDGIDYVVEDNIATITLNRPHRKNAFTYEMIDRWAGVLRSSQRDDEVRCVVLTGTGDAFCSGIDIDARKTVGSRPLQRMESLTRRVHEVARAAADLDKPLIAAVNGPAIGAGMDMALLSDLRVASTQARFVEGYVRLGLVPGAGGCFLLPRIVGLAKALELLWTAESVSAEEALRLGIVNTVTEPGELMRHAYALARRIAAAPPVTVSAIKRITVRSMATDFATSLELAAAESAVVQTTADSEEALAAFREKRPPQYHRA
jgi:enoyl-CoA hydratase/carnithine racemase